MRFEKALALIRKSDKKATIYRLGQPTIRYSWTKNGLTRVLTGKYPVPHPVMTRTITLYEISEEDWEYESENI